MGKVVDCSIWQQLCIAGNIQAEHATNNQVYVTYLLRLMYTRDQGQSYQMGEDNNVIDGRRTATTVHSILMTIQASSSA